MEREQLSTMTTKELAAYWNITQMSMKNIGDKQQWERHGPIVAELLKDRGIATTPGKLLNAVTLKPTRLT